MKDNIPPMHWSDAEPTDDEPIAYQREMTFIRSASAMMANTAGCLEPTVWVSMIALELVQNVDHMPVSTADMLRGVAAHLLDVAAPAFPTSTKAIH